MERSRNIRIGPKYEIRLSDLGQFHVLQAVCFRCSRWSIISPAILMARHGANARLVDLERHLKCGGCGNRFENHFEVSAMPRD